jgi:hypothetical protein
LLTGPLRDAEPALIAALLRESRPQTQVLSADDQRQIDAFADAYRTLESALPALERLVLQRAAGTAHRRITEILPTPQRDLLILSILQRREPDAIVAELGLSGRAELLRQLRVAIASLRALDA